MKFCIWVDADACPGNVRDLVLRSAVRRGVPAVLVANGSVAIPRSEFVELRLVPQGADKADDHIAEHAGEFDLAITGDIPLAARLAEKRVMVLSPRGDEWTSDNIGDLLATRNLMEALRAAGLAGGGPRESGAADMRRFANALDRFIAKRTKGANAPPGS